MFCREISEILLLYISPSIAAHRESAGGVRGGAISLSLFACISA